MLENVDIELFRMSARKRGKVTIFTISMPGILC